MLELCERALRRVTATSVATIINRAYFSGGVTGRRIQKKLKGTGQSARTIVRIAPKRRKYREESTARSTVTDISVTQMTTEKLSK